jgi:hypothetical protein
MYLVASNKTYIKKRINIILIGVLILGFLSLDNMIKINKKYEKLILNLQNSSYQQTKLNQHNVSNFKPYLINDSKIYLNHETLYELEQLITKKYVSLLMIIINLGSGAWILNMYICLLDNTIIIRTKDNYKFIASNLHDINYSSIIIFLLLLYQIIRNYIDINMECNLYNLKTYLNCLIINKILLLLDYTCIINVMFLVFNVLKGSFRIKYRKNYNRNRPN